MALQSGLQSMNCTNCGATVTPACLARGACTFCGAAIQAIRPPSVQQGVAEILQALGQGQTGNMQTLVSSSIVVNGRTYRSVDELPPELRAHVERGMRKAHHALGGLASNVMFQSVTTQASFEVPVSPVVAGRPMPALPAASDLRSTEGGEAPTRAGRVGLFVALAVTIVLIGVGAGIFAAR